jgi:hypothetical protein
MDLTNVLQPLLTQLGQFLIGLLNEDLVYITLATLVATQAVKVLVQWRIPNVPTSVIVFVLSPLVGIVIAGVTWSFNVRVPWFIVGIVASGLANLTYLLIVQKVLGKYAPNLREQLNLRPPGGGAP